jgi:hypothetical protein
MNGITRFNSTFDQWEYWEDKAYARPTRYNWARRNYFHNAHKMAFGDAYHQILEEQGSDAARKFYRDCKANGIIG